MISGKAFNTFRERAVKLLVARGYEPVPVDESHFLKYRVRLHLIGLMSCNEMLCVKLQMPYGSVSETYIESFCAFEICQFRSLLAIYPCDLLLRCEIWIRSPNRSIHCYEVLPETIREVAAYAR